jgi:hypothetical protein
MDEQELLTRLLAYAALIAATLEYAILVRHRVVARLAVAQSMEAQQVGLRGLVRVLLADERGDGPAA